MKNAQQAISTQCLLAVTFKRIDLNPESPSQLMTSPPSTQARALLDTCLSLPPVMQLISKFYIFSFGKKNCHLIIAMTFLLVSPALSFSPSNSSFPVDWVSILPSLQTLIVCSYSIRAKLGMWYSKFFHNLVPDSHSILCSGLLFQKCFQSFTQLFLLSGMPFLTLAPSQILIYTLNTVSSRMSSSNPSIHSSTHPSIPPSVHPSIHPSTNDHKDLLCPRNFSWGLKCRDYQRKHMSCPQCSRL